MADPAFIAARIHRWKKDSPQGPVTLELYPTLGCNLNCKFCDTTSRHHPQAPELPVTRQLHLVQEAAALDVRRIFVLGGGEPLLHRELAAPLLRSIKRLGLEGILTTNGTLLDAPLRDQLVETAWDEVQFSVDGPTPEIHDSLRGVPGAFRRTVTAACRLRGRRGASPLPRIALHFVLTRENYRTLPNMIRLAAALGAGRVDFDALIAWLPAQRALALDPAQAEELPAIAMTAHRLAQSLGIASSLHHLTDRRNLKRGSTISGPLTLASGGVHCLRPWHYLVVGADGRTAPCCVLSGLGGSVEGRTLEDLWRSDPFLEDLRGSFLAGRPHPRCRECSANILGHERLIRDHIPPGAPWST